MTKKNHPSNGAKIKEKNFAAVVDSPAQAAKMIDLVYVNDSTVGIRRVKKGKGFCYWIDRKNITDQKILDRINKLAIPPAWKDVWICQLENGHLQATGYDTLNRKQYRYHNLWSSFRNHTKFHRLYEFGKSLPRIRKRLNKDLTKPGLPLDKVLATVILLMEKTSIRVGNDRYEKLYGSFGLTTLRDKHTSIRGSTILFSFKGKKGIHHKITLKNKRLARIAKQCRDISGFELFQYYDQAGNHQPVNSGMVNDYLKSISGKDFTTKDFRTWIGSTTALNALKNIKTLKTENNLKTNIVTVVDQVASHLGNTRTVCKKYYIHPALIRLAENNEIDKYFSRSNKMKKSIRKLELSSNEKLLLYIIEQES